MLNRVKVAKVGVDYTKRALLNFFVGLHVRLILVKNVSKLVYYVKFCKLGDNY